MQQAVLEFDAAVQAPWRPSLRCVSSAPAADRPAGADRPAARPGAYRDRVAGSRPPVAVPARGARPAAPGRPLPPAPVPAVRPARPVPAGRARPAGPADVPASSRRVRRSRPATGPIRLTRRARRLGAVLALALGVALGSWLGPLVAGDGGDLRLAGVSTVVVAPGDTLWSIAASVAGDRDVRAVVDDIQQLNRLDGVDLAPGQVLQLP